MEKIKEVILSLTNRCNLKCRMCDVPLEKTDELSTGEWKRVIQDAYSLGASTVVFSGGEPLLRDDIYELMVFAKAKNLSVCITSNGNLLNDQSAGKMKEAGVNVVNISIDGPQEIHDYLRGKGAFSKANSALGLLERYGIECTIATMVCGYNYKHLPFVVELARKYCATTIKFQPFNSLFLRNKEDGKDYFLPREREAEFGRIIKETIRLCSKYGIVTNPQNYLEKMRFYLSGRAPEKINGCPALKTSCPIDSKGMVYPCWALSDSLNSIGDVRKEGLLRIWNSSRRASLVEKINRQGCRGCVMSCYDENFGKHDFSEKLAVRINRFREGRGISGIRNILRSWSKRVSFYSTYRGSLPAMKRRLGGFFKKRTQVSAAGRTEEFKRACRDLETARRMLKEEMRSNR